MHESLAEQVMGNGWSEQENRDWYQDRPRDDDYYRVQRELLRDGLTRKAKLVKLPPHEEGKPGLWAIGLEGSSPLRLPEASQHPLHVSVAFEDEWGQERAEMGPGGELRKRPAGAHLEFLQPPATAHQLVK